MEYVLLVTVQLDDFITWYVLNLLSDVKVNK